MRMADGCGLGCRDARDLMLSSDVRSAPVNGHESLMPASHSVRTYS